jgi:hypothetical protein
MALIQRSSSIARSLPRAAPVSEICPIGLPECPPMRRSLQVVLLAVALLLPTTAVAAAGPPPRGLYECTIGGLYFDEVKIKQDNQYERFGKTGKFAGKGRKINFTSGPFKGFKGRWYMADDGGGVQTPEIALKNPLNDFEDIYCSK